MEITRRIGLFFIILGVVLLALFFASDAQGNPILRYLLWGSVSFFGGGYLAWKTRRPPRKAQRFRLVRRLMAGRVENGDEDKKEGGGEKKEGDGEGKDI